MLNDIFTHTHTHTRVRAQIFRDIFQFYNCTLIWLDLKRNYKKELKNNRIIKNKLN